uniref:Biotin carboxyl carrier protein of acetyl-CoA carboxylase n=1 Tax=Laurencieae sp. TaxID=2007162 RepID=A0A1Z1M2W0_9FLOR|nr:acetyl-CoA carboxylase biotin carboxyl carrier protein [Laurencieae sp.]
MPSLNKIKHLIFSIQNSKIKKIKIEQKQIKIIINKTKKELINTYNDQINQEKRKKEENKINKSTEQITQTINKGTNIETKATDQSLMYSTIISPMVGTFYRSPAPNESPFIEINNIVKPKQTVCIIEAMKLMNEIESEVSGEIVEILVQDGDIVDCGQALMKVKTI